MKTSYRLPTGTYNLILNREDIIRLKDTGGLTIFVGKTPCATSRLVWDSEQKDLVTRDEKEIINDLCFRLHDPVDDIGPGVYNVQYINIILDKKEGTENDN